MLNDSKHNSVLEKHTLLMYKISTKTLRNAGYLLVTMQDSIECQTVTPAITEVMDINFLVAVNMHNFCSYTD